MTFSQMIATMQTFWQGKGCGILQSVDTEVGAATYHPHMLFGRGNVQFIQLSQRPQDGRAGLHPNRLFTHHQFQVVFEEVPHELERWVRECFNLLGLQDCDIRFVEDDWKNPTLGAAGIGWEVRCDEMEVLQYTYFQQIAGREHICAELAFGLERLAMHVQKVKSVYDLEWSEGLSYGEVRQRMEREQTLELDSYDPKDLIAMFDIHHRQTERLSELPVAAYIHCSKMSHIFNLLDAKQCLSHAERERYIKVIRGAVRQALANDAQLKLAGN